MMAVIGARMAAGAYNAGLIVTIKKSYCRYRPLSCPLQAGGATASAMYVYVLDRRAIDERARRAFVGDKAGLVEVIDLDTRQVVDTLPSEPNVHTLAVDPRTHAVYVYRNESNKVDVFVPR